jgi:hypothetical protein
MLWNNIRLLQDNNWPSNNVKVWIFHLNHKSLLLETMNWNSYLAHYIIQWEITSCHCFVGKGAETSISFDPSGSTTCPTTKIDTTGKYKQCNQQVTTRKHGIWKKNSIITLSNYSCYSHSYYKAHTTIQNKGDCLEWIPTHNGHI